MTLLNTIKREIHNRSKIRKFKKANLYEILFNNTPTVYIKSNYYNIYFGGFKPIKLGSSKYKLKIFLDYNYAICIDAKKILIFDDTNLPCGKLSNKPFFESYTISNEDFFNLSMQNVVLFTPDEIKELRQLMSKEFKNKVVTIFFKNLILSNLVPDRW